jgi:hypothetical protein
MTHTYLNVTMFLENAKNLEQAPRYGKQIAAPAMRHRKIIAPP